MARRRRRALPTGTPPQPGGESAAIEAGVDRRERLQRKTGQDMADTRFDGLLLLELRQRIEQLRKNTPSAKSTAPDRRQDTPSVLRTT